jgi:hypothetical protein
VPHKMNPSGGLLGACDYDLTSTCGCQLYHAPSEGRTCAACTHHVSYHTVLNENVHLLEGGPFGACKSLFPVHEQDGNDVITRPCKCKVFYLDDLGSTSCEGCQHHRGFHVPPFVKASCKVPFAGGNLGSSASPLHSSPQGGTLSSQSCHFPPFVTVEPASAPPLSAMVADPPELIKSTVPVANTGTVLPTTVPATKDTVEKLNPAWVKLLPRTQTTNSMICLWWQL